MADGLGPHHNPRSIDWDQPVLGPGMAKFLETCWSMEPVRLALAIGAGVICLLITWCICLRHWCALWQAPISLRRSFYLQITMFPTVTSSTAFLALLDPGSYKVLEAARTFYEALTLYRFGMMIFILVMYESSKIAPAVQHGGGADADPAPENSAKSITVALATFGKKKHFGVPPLGCFCRPCMSEFDLSLGQLRITWWMIHQYVIAVCVMSALRVYLLSVVSYRQMMAVEHVLLWFGKVSNIVCIYGLVVLLFATKELLSSWNIKKKFLAVKMAILVLAFQHFLINKFATPYIMESESCVKHAGFYEDPRGKNDHWAEVDAGWFSNAALVGEAILMAWLIKAAFPLEELQRRVDEVHHEFLEMRMRDHDRKAVCDVESASSDDASSDEDCRRSPPRVPGEEEIMNERAPTTSDDEA